MNWSHNPGSLTLVYLNTSWCFAQVKNLQTQNYQYKKFKKYTTDNFCDKLKDVNFANYSEFADVNDAFVDFSDKLKQAVDGIAPYREFRVKGHTEDWFDGAIMERINNRDKLIKK